MNTNRGQRKKLKKTAKSALETSRCYVLVVLMEGENYLRCIGDVSKADKKERTMGQSLITSMFSDAMNATQASNIKIQTALYEAENAKKANNLKEQRSKELSTTPEQSRTTPPNPPGQ